MSATLGAQNSQMAGIAGRIPAPRPVTLEEGAALLQADGGTITAAITITRAGTGKVEHYSIGLTPTDKPKEA